MRIAVVGPTHPYKGGIAQHTTELARRLQREGHDVVLESWRRQYPRRLYPGQMTVRDGQRDVADFEPTVRRLTWYNPFTWLLTGYRSRHADLVVVAHSNPFQVPAHLAIICVARAFRRARSVVVAHNVMPHEASRYARPMVHLLARAANGVIVHSADERAKARVHFRGVACAQIDLPPFGPAVGIDDATARPRVVSPTEPVQLLALGFVRPYKGLEVLLEAMKDLPHLALTIRGECWDDGLADAILAFERLPQLRGRVTFRPGYVDEDEVADLFRRHDIAALPYLDATGSQNVLLAFTFGLPVIASDLPTLSGAVRHGENGLVVRPGDVAAWRDALATLDRAAVEELTRHVERPRVDDRWREYVAAVTQFAPSAPGEFTQVS